MHHTVLARWLSEQFGQGKRFRSARQLSFAAGLNANQVGTVLERGKTSADTLLKIARALDLSPVEVFIAAGLLTEKDLPQPAGPIKADERELLEGFRRLSPEARAMLLGGVREARAHYHVKDAPGRAEDQRRPGGPGQPSS